MSCVLMRSLASMKQSGVLRDGVGGRILRSHTSSSSRGVAVGVQNNNVKLADSKITFKAKKGGSSKVSKAVVEKLNLTSTEELVGQGTVSEVGKVVPGKGRRGRVKKTKESVVVSVEQIVGGEEVGAGGGVGALGVVDPVVVADVGVGGTLLSEVKSSWSVSLSSADALAEATKYLVGADGRLGSIIGSHSQGPQFKRDSDCFNALLRSIVYQQLAGKAAAAIYGRLIALCGGPDNVTPSIIAALTDVQLREVGISGRKASYLHDLAQKFLSGDLSDEKLYLLNEDELVVALTAVKGIGVWSAHMFMIFHLHKPDVLPVGDLAIRKGFQKLYQLKALPAPAEMETLASTWRPYRTLGSWYLWRASEVKLPDC